MRTVKEHLAWWPRVDDTTVIERDEALILQGPWAKPIRPLPVGKADAGGPPPGAGGGGANGGSPSGPGAGGPPGGGPGRPRAEREAVEVVHVEVAYTPRAFSPPLWVYENEDVRIEHQA
jgi:hypothetical protein